MKKNLILIVSVCLVFLMAVSVVSAGWFTGQVTKVEDGGEINIYDTGEEKEFEFNGKEYSITDIVIEGNTTYFRVGDVKEGIKKEKNLVVGDSDEFGNIIIEVVKIDSPSFLKKLFSSAKHRVRLKISTAKSGEKVFCRDSDEKDYYVMGNVRGYWNDSTTDEIEYDGCCIGCEIGMSPDEIRKTEMIQVGTGENVIEVFCGDDGYIDIEVGYCPNGCKDGACVKSTTSSEVTYAGVLEMLSKCVIQGVYGNETIDGSNCNDICENAGNAYFDTNEMFCVDAYNFYEVNGKFNLYLHDCKDNTINYPKWCRCCSA